MLIDGFGRKHDYLRVSVTERCNFRCQYCMPEKPFSWVPKENLLSYEDLFKFIKASIDEGIKKVRITGGEPLLREGLEQFIKMIYDYKNDIDLALTTNGFLLPNAAQKLKDAGLKRINISLDSLNAATAAKIAQKDVLETVLEGIQAAADAGLKIKINCVPIKGINDVDLVEVLDFCKSEGYVVRFIEFMENNHAKDGAKGLNSDEIKAIIATKYPNFKMVPRDNSSPAQYYELEDGFQFGIIEPHKDDSGVWHNSVDDSEMFSTSGFLGDNTKTVYQASTLVAGSHTVTFRCLDSDLLSPSTEVIRTFIVLPSPFETITANVTHVKAMHILALRTAVNTIRQYYGMEIVSWDEEIVAVKTAVREWPYHIMELRAALEPVITMINSFDTSSTFDIPPVTWLPIGTGRPKADVVQQIQNLLLTM